MSYLDVAPLISALRNTPEEFELSDDWLHHLRSHHCFRVTKAGRVDIGAACDCSLLSVRADQEHEFAASFREWRTSYWRAIEINREFASHFAPRPRVLQWLVDASGSLHRWLGSGDPVVRGSPSSGRDPQADL